MGRQKRVTPVKIPDETALTQYGECGLLDGKPQFHNRLRPEIGEAEMSLIMGRVDAVAGSVLVTKLLKRRALVRYTTAGQLRAAGFVLVSSPSQGNNAHVSVYAPYIEGADGDRQEWGDALAALFDACFTEAEEGGA